MLWLRDAVLHARSKVMSSGRGPWPFVSDSRGAEREAARIKSAPPSAACCPHPLPPAMPALAPPPAVAAVAAAEAAATHCCRRCRQCHCHRNCRRHCRPCCPPPNPPTHQPRTPAGTTMPSNPPAAPPQPPANNSSTSVQSSKLQQVSNFLGERKPDLHDIMARCTCWHANDHQASTKPMLLAPATTSLTAVARRKIEC